MEHLPDDKHISSSDMEPPKTHKTLAFSVESMLSNNKKVGEGKDDHPNSDSAASRVTDPEHASDHSDTEDIELDVEETDERGSPSSSHSTPTPSSNCKQSAFSVEGLLASGGGVKAPMGVGEHPLAYPHPLVNMHVGMGMEGSPWAASLTLPWLNHTPLPTAPSKSFSLFTFLHNLTSRPIICECLYTQIE